MKRTQHDEVDDWLDDLELTKSKMRDGSRLARIGAALDQLERAQQDLDDAIAAAHAAGDSWSAIGAVLGTSRQAAHRKYASRTVGADRSVPSKRSA